MEQFIKLLSLALVDGELSIKEKELLLMKASELGMDAIEAEMIIEGELSKLARNTEKIIEESDGFLISNEDLLLRTTKWVNRVSKKTIKVEVEPFPRLNVDAKSYHKYTDEALAIFNKINSSEIVNILGMIPGAGSIIKFGFNLGGVTKFQKIEHNEIIEIADKYLLILELRSRSDEFMLMKFKDLKENYSLQLNSFEKENKKGLRGFFR